MCPHGHIPSLCPAAASAQLLPADLASGFKQGYEFTLKCSDNVTTNGIAANSGIIDTEITNSAIGSTTTALTVAGTSTRANLDTSTIFYNTTALSATGNGSIIRISNNVIYDNSTNFTIGTGATIATTGNNRVKPAGTTNPNGTVTQQ